MRKPIYAICEQGADQPVHPRSLISAFVVRCLDRSTLAKSIQNFKTVAVFEAKQTGLSLTAYRVEKHQRQVFS